MNSKGPVAALDIGGTKLSAAVVSEGGTVSAKVVAPTEASRGPADTLGRALDLAEQVWKDAQKAGLSLTALGVASKGITTEDAVHIFGIPGWEAMRVPALLRERFPGVPTAIMNDVKAATLAEMNWGALKGTFEGLYVNLGTGIAVGVVSGAELRRGAHDAAGEVGYMVPSRDALRERKPGQAPLEDWIAGQAIPGRAQARLGAPASAEQLVQLARSDANAAQLLAEVVEEIGIWVTNISLVVDPQKVVIGGGFLHWGPGLLDKVEEIVRDCVPFPPQVVAAHFGADSALMGAGALALSLTP